MERTVAKKRAYQITRARRTRMRVRHESTRPRLSVFRSGKHMYAQIIDDKSGKTLVSVHDIKNEAKGKKKAPLISAGEVGTAIAEKAQAQNIREVVFDRGGYRYHGRVRALADAARKAGLKF